MVNEYGNLIFLPFSSLREMLAFSTYYYRPFSYYGETTVIHMCVLAHKCI